MLTGNNIEIQETKEEIIKLSQNRNSNDNIKSIKAIIFTLIIIVKLLLVCFSIIRFASLINKII